MHDVQGNSFDPSIAVQASAEYGQENISIPWQVLSDEFNMGTGSTPGAFLEDDAQGQSFTSSASPGSETSETHRNAMELPLDQPSWTFKLLGESGESDPHLLKRSTLAIHAENMHFRRFQRDPTQASDLDCHRPIVFSLGRDNLYNNYEPRVKDSELSVIRKELARINSDVGIRLVSLYFKYIHPYFPVLSRYQMFEGGLVIENSTLSLLPLSLKAALYASALPYMVYDDVLSTMLDVDLPTAKELHRMCWSAITQEIHTPRLSTLQSCLLLLQRDNIDRFVQGSPFQWSLLAWTVSLAQTLGLSTDCSTVWGMPEWEKRLRKRLWWATYVLDKWNFACSGLTSHIHKDDYDVSPLADDDDASSQFGTENSHNAQNHFRHLVELTSILSDTIDSFFTIKASKRTSTNFNITCSLANDLITRLHEWKEKFDAFTSYQLTHQSPRTRLDGNASLGLAYWAVHLLISRAILRSLEAKVGTTEDKQLREECSESVRLKAESCCVEVIEFTDKLQAGSWNAFWHKFSPSNFAIASSVMMRLLMTSVSQVEKERLNNLIDRWRWVLRSGGGNTGGAMMSLGLLRLDRTLLKSHVHD
ncbi:hypothetical protein N7456_003879 [Penicillium angulare]|uniref:Xylanolytic transcriptional activator regulatory domain-containing protein n=1 Tax=Penicillium angulare TaxID=116970 RepID=A0A9W9KHW1_9EURO|nr:hypothetical protein N7456_003879 [Penicillium angulare]